MRFFSPFFSFVFAFVVEGGGRFSVARFPPPGASQQQRGPLSSTGRPWPLALLPGSMS
jgi:hypothetical protein